MSIDPATRASLEIHRAQDGGRAGSLLACVDRTVTAGGARLLAARLTRPLMDLDAIGARLEAVGWFAERRRLREDVRALLAGSGDMARALGRLVLNRGGPRDLGVVRTGLRAGEEIAARFAAEGAGVSEALSGPPVEITGALDALALLDKPELARLAAELEAGLLPELPAQAREGGYVAEGIGRSWMRPGRCATTAGASSPRWRPGCRAKRAWRCVSGTMRCWVISWRPAPRRASRCCDRR